MNEIMQNPLVASHQLDTTDINIIISEYYNIYILTLKENITEIDEAIYSYNIDKELYNRISNNIIMIKAPSSLIKNFTHYSKITILSKNVIEKFNINNYQLHDKNLVLMMFNISYQNIKLYLLQYEKTNTLVDIYKTMIVNKYFNIDFKNYTALEVLKKNILNINESNYWTYSYNCFPNLSVCFEKRKLNYHYLKNINKEFENYLKDALKKSNYIDPSRILLTSEYKYKINTNNVFSKEDITNLIIGLPNRERFLLFCNLIISKSYSHLILNNKEILLLMKPVIIKFIQLFRYLFGYAWIRFYFEESIKKSYTTKDDQFIFDIDTAALLPLFPFSMSNPKMNPYCTILVNDNILNSEYNLGGILDYKEQSINKFKNNKYKVFSNNGITTLNEFKQNLNIFLTGNQNKDILEHINWKKLNIAIGGSIMCACIQKHHPLVDLFSNYSEDEKLKRYYSEYYANADVDIMFLGEDVLDFMDRVNEFYNQIIINICNLNPYAEPAHIKLACNKFIYLFVTKNDINEIISKNFELSYDKIINNFELPEIKNLFLDLLSVELQKYKNEFFSKLTKEQIEKYKVHYKDYINFDNLEFRIRLSKKREYIDDDSIDESNNYKTGINITYKYKLHSQHLDFPFELFMIKYSFMSVVQNFHLPCVRSYYDGSNVYLTPSCITAHLTYMNIDYKYFAGTKNPIEIINKYRMRGFGTWLNEDEKIILLKYSAENQNWNNLYCINFIDEKSLVSNLGSLNIDHKIFRPRLFNPDDFINVQPIDIQIGYFNVNNISCDKLKTKHDYVIELDERYDNKNNQQYLQLILEKLQTINELGSINPVEKWIIESAWNISNFKENNNESTRIATPLKYKYIK
jgi:hypothetical protein